MTFSYALFHLNEGEKITRTSWNGKGQYIVLGSNLSWKEPDGSIVNHDNINIGNKAIIFHGTSGTQVGWLATQGDILADDWTVVE